jgi:hypothetical protein
MKRKINAYAVCFNPKNLHVVSSDFCFDTDFPCDICDICDICGNGTNQNWIWTTTKRNMRQA